MLRSGARSTKEKHILTEGLDTRDGTSGYDRFGASWYGYLTISNARFVVEGLREYLRGRKYTWSSSYGVDGGRGRCSRIDVRTGQRLIPNRQSNDIEGVSLTYYPSSLDSYRASLAIPEAEVEAACENNLIESVHIGVSCTYGYWGLSSRVWTQQEAYEANLQQEGSVPYIACDANTSLNDKITILQTSMSGDALCWVIAREPFPFDELLGKAPNIHDLAEPLSFAVNQLRRVIEWNDPDGPPFLRIGELVGEDMERARKLLSALELSQEMVRKLTN